MPRVARKLILGGAWLMGISYVLFSLNFFSNIFVARFLGPESYGIFIFVSSLQVTTGLFISLPINLAFIRSDGSQQVFDAAWILSFLVGVVNLLIGLIGGLAVGFTYGYLSGAIFFLLFGAQLPLMMASIYLAPYEKSMDFKKVSVISGGASTIGAGAALFAAWYGAGVWSLVAREIIPVLVLWLMVYRFTNTRFSGYWARSDCISLLRESLKFCASRILEQGFFRVPFVLIGHLFGQTSLGLFNQAFYIANLPNTLLSPISDRVAFSGYASVQGEMHKISKGLFITNYVIIRLITPVGLGIYLFGDRMIYFLYGEEWNVAGEVFAILGLFAALNPLFSNAKTACYGIGHQDWVSHAYLVSILALIVAIEVASQVGSMRTMAIGYGVAVAIGLVYMLIRLRARGINLKLLKLVIPPLLYCLLVIVLIHVAKPVSTKTPQDVLYLSGLILLYPALILCLEGRKIRQAARMLT